MNKRHLTIVKNKQAIEFNNSVTIGEYGPILLPEYSLFKKKAYYNREYLPNIQHELIGISNELKIRNQAHLKFIYYLHNHLLPVSKKESVNLNDRPNSIDDVFDDSKTKELPLPLQSNIADWFDRHEEDNDQFT